MAEQPQKIEENFATSGTEVFELSGEGESGEQPIVLNIQEDQAGAKLLLDAAIGGSEESTGNVIVDTFKTINLYFIKHSKVKIVHKANFFHLLAVMVNSGIPMIKALHSLSAQMDDSPRLKLVVEEIADYIEGGASFSESLSSYPDIFGEKEIGMIQSGEASGQLGSILETLARDTEKAHQIRSKVKAALTYPVVIFFLLIAVIVVMMVYVVPQLTDLFANAGEDLPTITKVVVAISDFMINEKFLIIVTLVALIGGIILFKKTPPGRYFFDKLLLKLPIFGKLIQMTLLSRFARSFSNLLESRISIVRAMEITANSIGNEVYRKRLMLSVDDIEQGIPIAESLAENPLFPGMMVSMLEVGEKTAQMDTISATIADFYENEVDTAVAGISKVIEPVILVVIGLTVGGVVAAIMLPIMQLSNIAGEI